METKQVIIIRKDLNMRKGKMIAQGAHASLKAVLSLLIQPGYQSLIKFDYVSFDEPLYYWLNGLYTKIVVGCDSEAELFELKRKADDAGILNAIIKDAGLTEFKEPTYTCLAIGPDLSEKIDKITSHLKLL